MKDGIANSLFIHTKVLNDIYSYFDNAINEKGGALLLDSSNNFLFLFIPLTNISDNPSIEYMFSFDELNMKLKEYDDDNINFIGIIHSHPDYPYPSKEDIDFFSNLLKENGYEYLLFPIYSSKDKPFIRWWKLDCGSVTEVEVIPIE